MDDLAYATSSFEGFVIEDTDFATWFLASSTKPIIDDCCLSEGKVLGGIACAQRALEAHLGLHVEALQARVRNLESAVVTKEGYMQEEIVRALAPKRELWQRERES